MEIVTGDLKDHERRIAVLEVENATNKSNIAHITKAIDNIEANTTWTFRLVVGALVTGALGGMVALFFKIATG